VGLYVGRIFEQVKNRPLFLIDAEADGAREDAWSDAEGRSGPPQSDEPAAST
jgi:hypothetical protein